MTTPNGPLMDQGAFNAAVYDMQHKFPGIETWATVVNDAITGHADHIDHSTARLESFHSGMASARLRHDQLSKDVVEVMTRMQTNDDELKA